MWFWIWLLLAVAADMAGIFSAKKWADGEQQYWLLATLFCYLLVGLFFAQVLRFEGVTIANVVWTMAAVIFGTLLGTLVFHEKLESLQWVGVFLAVLGVILIQWPTK